jgi:hypothetical protein
MRKFILISLFVFTTVTLKAQSMEFLDINRVKAAFWADGTMFWDKVSSPLFEWPQDSGTHVNFSTALWLGGVNSTGTLMGAYRRYGTVGEDYFPGPLDTINGTIDSTTMAIYNKVWKINKTEVDQFILCNCLNPSDPSCTGYLIPNSILNWPGNPIVQSGGQNLLMDQQLAPYYDANGDGFYDPSDCDYPLVKCDQSLFFVYNDRGGLHMESQLPSIGLEVRAMAYACSCDSVTNLYPDLENTIFLDLEVIHRGADTLFQTYAGLYSDADIGGSPDDYIGTHVDEGYVYHYNADAFDNDYGGTQGYGALPPAHGIVYLKGPWMDANGVADFWDPSWDPGSAPSQSLAAIVDYTDTTRTSVVYGINGTGFNDSIVDNERLGLNRSKYVGGPIGDPNSSDDYYNAQRSMWNDGSFQTFGCDGYPSGSCASSSLAYFAYPDTSDPWNWGTKGIATSFAWSEFNTGGAPPVNPALDQRALGSAGPFTMFPGETNHLTYAFVTARTTTPADGQSLLALNQAVVNVKNIYFNGMSGCGFSIGLEEPGEELLIKMYPNPAEGTIWLESTDLDNANIRIVDLTGRCVYVIANQVSGSTISIPIENLVPGIYIVTITKEGSSKSLKLIKK